MPESSPPSIRPPASALGPSERRLLQHIWHRGPIARSELAAIIGLTEASVSRLTRDLLRAGWIVETVIRDGAKGQPRRPLLVNRAAASAYGVYFSHEAIEVGLVDLTGNLLQRASRPLAGTAVEDIAGATEACLRELATGLVVDPATVLGIGFALPGDFIGDGARINAHAYFPELMHVDLQSALSERFPFPVTVDNDAASATLGELVHGIGRRFQNLLFLHLGHGIGSGIAIDGRLYRGARGNSGIVGVQFPNDLPRPSGQDLFATLQAHGIAVDSFTALGTLSPRECAPLQGWLRRAGRQLAACLGLTARIVDPEAVVLGGRFPLSLIRELVCEIEAAGFCDEGVHLPRPRLYPSTLGPEAGLIGSACLAFEQQLFAPSA